MKIYFEYDVSELINKLKVADVYLECEAIVLENIKKHTDKNISIIFIEGYIKKLHRYFEDKTVINKGNADCINYRYAAGFLNTIIATPYWHSWIKTSD